jgi:hypothetical protein
MAVEGGSSQGGNSLLPNLFQVQSDFAKKYHPGKLPTPKKTQTQCIVLGVVLAFVSIAVLGAVSLGIFLALLCGVTGLVMSSIEVSRLAVWNEKSAFLQNRWICHQCGQDWPTNASCPAGRHL